jgi:hypothetical protein
LQFFRIYEKVFLNRLENRQKLNPPLTPPERGIGQFPAFRKRKAKQIMFDIIFQIKPHAAIPLLGGARGG